MEPTIYKLQCSSVQYKDPCCGITWGFSKHFCDTGNLPLYGASCLSPPFHFPPTFPFRPSFLLPPPLSPSPHFSLWGVSLSFFLGGRLHRSAVRKVRRQAGAWEPALALLEGAPSLAVQPNDAPKRKQHVCNGGKTGWRVCLPRCLCFFFWLVRLPSCFFCLKRGLLNLVFLFCLWRVCVTLFFEGFVCSGVFFFGGFV